MIDDLQTQRYHLIVPHTPTKVNKQTIHKRHGDDTALTQINKFYEYDGGDQNCFATFVSRREDPPGARAESPASGPRGRTFLQMPQQSMSIRGIHKCRRLALAAR